MFLLISAGSMSMWIFFELGESCFLTVRLSSLCGSFLVEARPGNCSATPIESNSPECQRQRWNVLLRLGIAFFPLSGGHPIIGQLAF